MLSIRRLLAFISANAIGFFSPMFCYYVATITKMHSVSDPGFNAEEFRSWFLGGIMMTWLICAIFSLGYFFADGKSRVIFLLAPILVPVIYGFSVLAGFLSSL
jgi:hypothetical protein